MDVSRNLKNILIITNILFFQLERTQQTLVKVSINEINNNLRKYISKCVHKNGSSSKNSKKKISQSQANNR